ncbi:MAG TPA: pyridoxal phosphate-dependent aminotransferase [Pseudonocardiaceae bacterium]|nr:pyridoxal phosphate-dependent aminotransferase [Pseudonocardiaceae bacterium]
MTTFAPSPMSNLTDAHSRYDLAASTCPPLSIGELADPAELAALALDYGTSRGDDELRTLLAEGTEVRAEQVLVTVGAIEALFLLAQASCGPGDHVLLATPCFPPTRIVPAGLGAVIDTLPLSFADGYRLPLGRLADALTPRTRLMSLASPQNPSGVRFTEAELHAAIDVVAQRAPQARILVDETFRESTYGTDPVPPSIAGFSPRLVTCSSLSKALGAPGIRLGWLTTTDAELYEQLRTAKFHSTIACSTVDEFLGVRVLRRRAEILGPRAELLGTQLAELLDWTREQPVEIVRPDGGAICCLRLPEAEFTDDAVTAFYARLAENEVTVAAGSWFGDTDRVFRLGFGNLAPELFSTALDRLADAVKRARAGSASQ